MEVTPVLAQHREGMMFNVSTHKENRTLRALVINKYKYKQRKPNAEAERTLKSTQDPKPTAQAAQHHPMQRRELPAYINLMGT